MGFKPLSDREEEIAKAIVEAAYRVHNALGPGLLEKIYEVCFCHELSKMGFKVPLIKDGIKRFIL